MDLSDKVVVVTGASRGIGAALAKVALSAGARVGVCARSCSGMAELPRVLQQEFDVADGAEMDRFAERVAAAFGHIDAWINNAGILGPVGPIRGVDPAEFRRALDVNLHGVLLGSRAYAAHCHRSGRPGVLLNVSSGAARNPYPGWGAYCATKAAVDHLSRVLAVEEAGRIRVHAVAPGVVESDMQAQVRESPTDLFPQVQRFRDLHMNGELANPKDAAAKLLRLAFDPRCAAVDDVCVDVRHLPG